MRFLSDILAKAGLIVDGAAVFNSSATGQTPATNDNSTKFATTAWVRSFVQPYTLPIASSTILGGVKVGTGLAIDTLTGVLSVSGGSITLKSTQTFTATAGQSIFTIANGYTVGLIDVFLNGVYLSPGQTTATNGSTITLTDPALAGDIIDVIITSPIGQGSIATTDSLPEGTVNLYYTPARVRAAISLTTTGVSGAATYNNVTGVFNIPNYQGLVPANGVAGQILAKASGTSYDTTWIDNYTSQVQHQVKLGAAMTIGTPVYVSGSTGNSGTNMIVSKASNATEGTSSKTLGLLASGGNTNDIVFVITEGLLAGLDTSTASAGDPVWLGVNGALIFGLLNKPVAPAHLVFIGIVTRAQQNNGEIFVKVQNGFELDELHDLSVKNASDGDMIKYVASTGLWTKITASTTNIVEGTNLYYTNARVASYLTANSYATQGYVNTAISNLVASAPTTLDTLNELATALGNDPNFATTIATSIGTKVPQTRTITINGTGYDLSADRSWSIAAGVTSFNTRTGAITLTSGDVTGALGFTPYNSTNPSGYITSSALSSYLLLSGGTLTGLLTIGNFDGQALKLQAGTSTGNTYLRFFNSIGTPRGYMGLFNSGGVDYLLLDGSSTDVTINGANNLYLQTNGANRLFISTTGAATFSSSVTASQLFAGSSTHGYLNLTAVNTGGNEAGIFFNINGNKWEQYTAANDLAMNWYSYSTSSIVMKLMQDGKLGIATVSPNHKLQVGTNGALGSWMSAAFQDGIGVAPSGSRSATYLYSDASTLWGLNAYDYATGVYKDVTVGWGGSANVLLAVNGGKVGVGITSPLYALDVVSSGGIVSRFTGNSGAYIILQSNGVRNWWIANGVVSGTDGWFGLYNATAGVNAFTITSGNNVLIGTTTDSGYKLDVNGAARVTNELWLNSTAQSSLVFTLSGTNKYNIAYNTNSYLQFYNYIANNVAMVIASNSYIGIATTNPLAPLHVNGDIRTTGLRLNQGTNNQGHRIYSRTMDVSAYSSQTSMRFTVASGNNVQFQYEITFHATRLSGNLVEIWYLRYTGGVAYDTAGNPNERWWDLREQAGNGIAGVGRNNNTGNLEITNSAFDTSCRLTVCVKITCNNWDAVTVSFS